MCDGNLFHSWSRSAHAKCKCSRDSVRQIERIGTFGTIYCLANWRHSYFVSQPPLPVLLCHHNSFRSGFALQFSIFSRWIANVPWIILDQIDTDTNTKQAEKVCACFVLYFRWVYLFDKNSTMIVMILQHCFGIGYTKICVYLFAGLLGDLISWFMLSMENCAVQFVGQTGCLRK